MQVNKDEYNKDKKFSPKITSPAPELTNLQDGSIGFQLQVPRGGMELEASSKFFFARISLFCYS